MPVVTAFIKEVSRLANPIDSLLPRRVEVDVKLPNGDIMPAGTEWTVDIVRMGQVRLLVKSNLSLGFSITKMYGEQNQANSTHHDF